METITHTATTNDCNDLRGYVSEVGNADNFNTVTKSLLSKAYIAFTGSVFDRIITDNNLSSLEKLYYLLADGLSLVNSNSGKQRSIALPSEKWAIRLNCSRSQIFALQKSLSKKGYFLIVKEKNKRGQNKRNLVIPTLPDEVFEDICKSAASKLGETSFYNPLVECKRGFLDKTKLFIPINYQLLLNVTKNAILNPLQKILWLDLFARAVKAKQFSLIVSFAELAGRHSCTSKNISKLIIALQEHQFLGAKRFSITSEFEQHRQDKCLWKIDLNLPLDHLQLLANTNDRVNLPEASYIIQNKYSGVNVADSDPHFAKSGLLLSKDFKAKKIDNIRSSSLPKFWANSITGRESESIFFDKNEVFANSVQTTTVGATVTSGTKKLTDFYPLSPQDCALLQSSSRREFTLQAMNEILLDMANRLTDRYFTGKKAFLSYMSKAFAYEKRDAVKISNVDFKIRANHSRQDQMRIREEFLTKIENSCSVSLEDHFRKKLAAILEPAKAYQLLQALQRIERVRDKIKLFLNKEVPLTANQRQIILAQAKAVYERLSLAGEEVSAVGHLEIIANKFGNRNWRITANPASDDKGNGLEVTGNDTSNETDSDDDIVWQAIREKLRAIYGIAVDRNWFSKLVAIRDETAKTITLQAPSPFIKDRISSNYQENIEKMANDLSYNLSKIEVK